MPFNINIIETDVRNAIKLREEVITFSTSFENLSLDAIDKLKKDIGEYFSDNQLTTHGISQRIKTNKVAGILLLIVDINMEVFQKNSDIATNKTENHPLIQIVAEEIQKQTKAELDEKIKLESKTMSLNAPISNNIAVGQTDQNVTEASNSSSSKTELGATAVQQPLTVTGNNSDENNNFPKCKQAILDYFKVQLKCLRERANVDADNKNQKYIDLYNAYQRIANPNIVKDIKGLRTEIDQIKNITQKHRSALRQILAYFTCFINKHTDFFQPTSYKELQQVLKQDAFKDTPIIEDTKSYSPTAGG